MKVELDEYGVYSITPEGIETCSDIACAVIMSVYSRGQVFGYGGLRAFTTELTKEMALRMLKGEDISKDYFTNPNKLNEVYMDYVFGRCCKSSINIKDGKVYGHISTRDQNPKSVLDGVRVLLKGGV